VHRDYDPIAVEKDEVQRKPHAKGVDARAARNQQAGTGALPVEVGEAEQAGARAPRHRNGSALDIRPRQAAQASR